MITHSYRTVPATASLLTLEKAKKQLRIEAGFTDEDDLIQSYIDAAEAACENYINRSIAKRKFVMELSAFETPVVFERNYENDVIAKIEYYAPGETAPTILPTDQYKLRNADIVECSEIKFFSMPETAKRDDAVIITIEQGFAVEQCPKPIIQAINLRLSDFYERREDREQGDNPASNNLLRAYRKY
jgi:uncharacterized phiE125 gp8 family phage protein